MVDFSIVEGNPGAFTFLMEAYQFDMFQAERCFSRMQKFGITGSKLYMLWNDCCDRDTKKTLDAMECMGIDDIVRHINYGEGRGIPIEDVELIKRTNGGLNETT